MDGITNAMKMNLGKLQEMVRDREDWHAAVHEVTESDMTGQLNNSNNKDGTLTNGVSALIRSSKRTPSPLAALLRDTVNSLTWKRALT